MSARRWKIWGWGCEGERPGGDRGAAAPAVLRRAIRRRRPPRPPDAENRGRRPARPAHRAPCPARPPLLHRPLRAPAPHLRQVVPERRAGVHAGLQRSPGCRRHASLRDGRDRDPGLGGGRRRRGDPVRRRLERGRRRGPGRGRWLRRHDQPRSQGARSNPGGRPHQPRRAHPGRHPRPGPRGRLEAARSHAPAFSAELRVLDAGRLDRDPLGRPFRDALHPHRRLRRKPARGDACGRAREPAPARIRRRAEPGSPDDRLRGRARA